MEKTANALQIPAPKAMMGEMGMVYSSARQSALANDHPHFTTYGSSPKKRARLMARANSRCFFADTAVIRLGTILPRSET
jgi:hypothetical protein